MASESCKHGNAAPAAIIEALPPSQAGLARHRCAVCAYEAGFAAGLREALRRAEGRREAPH